LALTVEKLERGFDPPRPLLIWAVGSSFTNGLGNGDLLAELIRERFEHAPPIVYKKIAGNSTSYHFSRGWARHLVIPDQPDVAGDVPEAWRRVRRESPRTDPVHAGSSTDG
jgi:hypothetical protein